ncbi:hypothetical protein Vadar_002948 [Vaccinium darrowii]|uniref:Uncharacterized protein n=1 Tax=Vaccinium darrowii TaxID=229202 RepID=A0ACB7Z375_9ERIC|nr:hypothetical protein Vadar_002948 [Vaccinium darrowii]
MKVGIKISIKFWHKIFLANHTLTIETSIGTAPTIAKAKSERGRWVGGVLGGGGREDVCEHGPSSGDAGLLAMVGDGVVGLVGFFNFFTALEHLCNCKSATTGERWVIPMENFATRSINGRSSSSNNINTHVAISIHTRDTLEAVVTDVVMTKPRCMEKVPLTIREDEKTKRHFDPRVVSVGPYHHGKENLQMAERIKPIVAQSFVSSSGRDMAEFRQKILEIVDDARRYYLEGSTDKYSNEKFAEMMLLDGIFVAAIMESMTSANMGRTIQDELKEHLGAHAVYLMLTDIFLLLENQLPYQVLELLMSLKSDRYDFLDTMDRIWDIVKCRGLNHNPSQTEPNRSFYPKGLSHKFKKNLDYVRASTKKPLHHIEYFWLQTNGFSPSNQTPKTNSCNKIEFRPDYLGVVYSFRSISELKARGIHARCGSSCPSRTFRFKSFFFFGVLEIPQIVLDPQFIIHISNQVAYEMTPNNPNNLPTMAYINFMKSLINSAEDVQELRSNNILFSTYNSDEEVVELLSSITTFCMEDFRIYDEVKWKIQKHYNSKAKTWIAQLIHKYFNSPWAFIAFVATTCLVTLSFLQTYFAIFPRSGK